MVHNQVPPVVVNTVMPEPHPAKKHKVGYIIVGVLELFVALSIIIIGVVSLVQGTHQVSELAHTETSALSSMFSNMDTNNSPSSDNSDLSNTLGSDLTGLGDNMNGDFGQNGFGESNDGSSSSLGSAFSDLANKYGSSLKTGSNGNFDQESMDNPLKSLTSDDSVKQAVSAGSNIILGFGIFTGVFVVAGMVLCIFSTIFAGIRLYLGVGLLLANEMLETSDSGIHIFSVSCSALMFVTAIVHSALCCAGSCCKGKRGTTVISQQHTIQMQPGYPDAATPYYDNPGHVGYTPEYVDDRMNQKLIQD